MNNLLPCPFCNSAAIIERNGKWHFGYCPSCGTNGPADLGVSGAIESWNNRPQNDKPLQSTDIISVTVHDLETRYVSRRAFDEAMEGKAKADFIISKLWTHLKAEWIELPHTQW